MLHREHSIAELAPHEVPGKFGLHGQLHAGPLLVVSVVPRPRILGHRPIVQPPVSPALRPLVQLVGRDQQVFIFEVAFFEPAEFSVPQNRPAGLLIRLPPRRLTILLTLVLLLSCIALGKPLPLGSPSLFWITSAWLCSQV